jgi:hypothetical protein
MAALTVVPTPNERRDGKPLRSLSRHERRRRLLVERLAKTFRPMEKFVAAVDYFRATAADHSLDAVTIERAVNDAAQDLIAAADQLAATRRIR